MSKIRKIVPPIKKKVIMLLVSCIALFLSVRFVASIFAQLQPVRSVDFFSSNTNYENKEEGAWKITKSSKWLSKGFVETTFDVDSIEKSESQYLDVLLVLDISDSMEDGRIKKLKSDTSELVDYLLTKDGNSVGLITFNTSSEIVSYFTDDKIELSNKIWDLEVSGNTNYYQALVNVDNVLKNYDYSGDRKCIVLFLTDGYPNEQTPNEEAQYNYLKNQYPFITINGVQYEMGDTILEQLKKITDSQLVANMSTLGNTLFEAIINATKYDNFKIEDYIDTDYFTIESDKDINTSQGTVNYDFDTKKLTWNINNYISGTNAKMTVKLKLNDNLSDDIYPISKKIEIISSMDKLSEDINSTKTTVLADNYKVIYDGNAPSECNLDSIPEEKHYNVFDVVKISNYTLKCDGYQFKGWGITNKDIDPEFFF